MSRTKMGQKWDAEPERTSATSICYEQSSRRIDTHNKCLIMWNTTHNTPSTIEVQMLARWLHDSPLFCCLRCDKFKDTKMPQAALEQLREG